MATRSLAAVVFTTALLVAQDPAAPAAPTTSSLPEAGTPAAIALVDKAVEKMMAYGRGTFSTTEASDNAMLRGAGLPFGQDDTVVDGGWHP